MLNMNALWQIDNNIQHKTDLQHVQMRSQQDTMQSLWIIDISNLPLMYSIRNVLSSHYKYFVMYVCMHIGSDVNIILKGSISHITCMVHTHYVW